MYFTKFRTLLFIGLLAVFWVHNAAAETKGIVWERLRFRPSVDLNQVYTDNVFLAESNEKEEYIATIITKLALDIALAPDNAITFLYEGDFRHYSEYNNFRNDHHAGGISWKAVTGKGSQFSVGTRYQDSAFQPFSPTDRSRDFYKWDTFGHALLMLGTASELNLKYDRASRRMDDSRDKIDDFDRDAIAISYYYQSFPASSILLEYAYSRQDNEDQGGASTDMKTHSLLGGVRWDPTSKLSGVFKAGYSKTDFEEVSDYSGFITEADLTYRFSEITTFLLGAHRALSRSTRAERETGDYLISTGGSFAILYNRWEKLGFRMDFTYINRDFESQDVLARQREDDFYRAAFLSKYRLTDPLSVHFRYEYKRNDSNYDTVKYKENRLELGIKFAL